MYFLLIPEALIISLKHKILLKQIEGESMAFNPLIK